MLDIEGRDGYVMLYRKINQECKTDTCMNCLHNYCMSPSAIYIRFSTAVAFSVHSGAVFVLEDKVTPRVADGRSAPAGGKETGNRRQRGRPSVTKVFRRVRGQGSICSGLGGDCIAGRDLLPWCVLLSFSACGWIFFSDWADFWTKKIYYS